MYFNQKPRTKRWEDFEIKSLAVYVKENSGELFGSGGGAAVEARKRKSWRGAAEAIRAAGGNLREWELVRKKWQDATFRAKKYHRDRLGKNVTGTAILKFFKQGRGLVQKMFICNLPTDRPDFKSLSACRTVVFFPSTMPGYNVVAMTLH